MPFKLPSPPPRRGIWGLLITVAFVIWTGYQMSSYATKKPDALPIIAQADRGPSYVEIDLRGPKYDDGRYAGFEKGKEAKRQGFTMPLANVLAFQSGELAKTIGLNPGDTTDFVAGYQSGFAQAMNEKNSAELTPAALQK